MLAHTHPTPRNPERVVLLGGSGFIGQAIAARLRAEAIATAAPASAELDLGGCGAPAALEAFLRPSDSLVILAARTPDRGRGIDTFMANLRMLEHVCLALARRPPAHVVYFSSDAVYPMGAGLIREDSPAAPPDLYGAMHRARELMLAEVAPGSLCVLRPTMVLGAGDTHNSYGPNRFRRQAGKEGRIVLGGAGEETRDHLYIDDLAELTLGVLTRRSLGLLNLASGTSTDFATVARLVAARFTAPVAIVTTPRQAPVSHRAFDITALLKAFPGHLGTPLERAVALAHEG